MNMQIRSMRDIFIEQLYERMLEDEYIFFLSADFGSAAMDKIRKKFNNERFINVGIAEQNLINISTGLALENYKVYAYAIAPFITMRAYEQNRVNLSMLSQIKDLNINLVSVGAGISYGLSGPTHHCLEDIVLMRLLPNFIVFSPSDNILSEKFVDVSLKLKKPKYIRLDGKALPQIYDRIENEDMERGFCELIKGNEICLIATGYMTHTALQVARDLAKEHISCGVIDVFFLKPFPVEEIYRKIKEYACIVTLEEGFKNSGGLDSAILSLLAERQTDIHFRGMGFADKYLFGLGGRECLHRQNNLDALAIVKIVKDWLKEVTAEKGKHSYARER